MLNSCSVEFESFPVAWSFLTLRRRGLWGIKRPLCTLSRTFELPRILLKAVVSLFILLANVKGWKAE